MDVETNGDAHESALQDVANTEAEVTLATGQLLQARSAVRSAEARLARAETLRDAAVNYYNSMHPRQRLQSRHALEV